MSNLTGYQLFTKEFIAGKRGISGKTNIQEAAQMWRAMSDLDKKDYNARAKTTKIAKKTPKPTRGLPGATKKKMFKDLYLERYPHSESTDAYAMWDSLSQADRDAYIGLIQ